MSLTASRITPLRITLEQPSDRAAVEALVLAAFGPGRFAKTAERLRERAGLVAGFVAREDHRLIGSVRLPYIGSLDVWRLASYGGGLFVPVKDALAGARGGTYSGGRYLLDTVKGADLGAGNAPDSLVLDFNFAYNPSCAYDPAWACPLAQPGNTVVVEIPVGERY